MNQRVTPSLTPEELELLWDFKGGHGMARMASRPDSTLRSWKESMHGRSAWPERADTKKDGIHFSNAEAGTSRVIHIATPRLRFGRVWVHDSSGSV